MKPEEDEKPTYAVGYGRPPREHQFKPGQSGNKKGRPKGAASIERMVKEELARNSTSLRRCSAKFRTMRPEPINGSPDRLPWVRLPAD
jgi:hypothetical protein